MQLNFQSIAEVSKPGKKWQKHFKQMWPGYKTWLQSKGKANQPTLAACEAALKKYMPKMWPTYKNLCELAGDDTVAHRFLTGFQPPAYISGCSQVVTLTDTVQLVRNYDYHPELLEGRQLLTAWNGKKVMGTSDCLIGLVDGMNENGLVVSLTFGGRKVVGLGFGIPFILRYILEFCDTVEEAVTMLQEIPSHMAYNVTVVDRTGKFKTVMLAPDKKPVVTDNPLATNHQEKIDWPENANFNKTLERYDYLKQRVEEDSFTSAEATAAFLKFPLYNTLFQQGFGTLYTASYNPIELEAGLHWPGEQLIQTFDNFEEINLLIQYQQASMAQPLGHYDDSLVTMDNEFYDPTLPWQQNVANIIAKSVPSNAQGDAAKNVADSFLQRGEISWEIIADYWSKIGDEH